MHTKGKVIFIRLNDKVIISTLGMSGWWYPHPAELTLPQAATAAYIPGRPPTSVGDVIRDAVDKHSRVQLHVATADGVKQSAFYVDARNFGNLKVVSPDQASEIELKLGIDLLRPNEYSINEWLGSLGKVKAKTPIGELLLDQSVACGLGNIYRAETLYLARVSPHRTLGALTEQERTRIFYCATTVLSMAYVNRGSMRYTYQHLSASAGIDTLQLKLDELTRFMDKVQLRYANHLVYNRTTDLYGHTVLREEIGGRTMHWCPDVQS